MRQDYKKPMRSERKTTGPAVKHWYVHGFVVLIGIISLPILLVESETSEASIPAVHEIQTTPAIHKKLEAEVEPKTSRMDPEQLDTYELALPPKAKDSYTNITTIPEASPELKWQTFKVKSGQNLGIISDRAGINHKEIYYLMQLGENVAHLKKLYPGDKVKMKITPEGYLAELKYDIHEFKQLHVMRNLEQTEPSFQAQLIESPLETRITHATGEIKNSLFNAGRAAGLGDRVTMELAYIFGWDIDFTMDVRQGDKFTVIYEETYRLGEKVAKSETILAAEFVNQGRTLRAIRYTSDDDRTDYYSPDGKSLRKTFLRNPIDIVRITSRFNLKRRHPVLHKVRAHRGVDYGAKQGTPIKATGDGKISFRGTKGGYGKTIIIQHGQKYSTLYAHMSRYASSTNKGRKVKQGQTIGYVGKTGLATGPHLHYEFRVNGVHKDPLRIKHPSVDPISKKYQAAFKAAAAPLLAQLNTLNETYLAAASQ